MAAGARQILQTGPERAWDKLSHFRASCSDWIAGHCSYELKEAPFGAARAKPDGVGFASMCFFQPEILVLVKGNEARIGIAGTHGLAVSVFRDITGRPVSPPSAGAREIRWQSRMSDEDYIEGVSGLQKHLRRGDAYEVNFCREFFAEEILLSPAALFRRLNSLSPAPFSAFYRSADHFLACSSPERFLRKNGTRVISQPMKGTAPRGKNPSEDLLRKTTLLQSAKERSENVMAVDLVRSDLSAVAVPGTVRVSELFGIQTFPSVHQMVSTVEAETDTRTLPGQILARAFPMGSMTGAPKHRVMQLIDEYECSARGIYSGAIGYFTPEGDFDFNVVIRSLAYHAGSRYLSFQTGSGITVYSDPRRELEECMLKGRALREAAATA